MQRRTLLCLLGACTAAAAVPPAAAHPTWQGLRQSRQRQRQRAPHRTEARKVQGRVLWVVPPGLKVGSELLHEERRVRVREIWRLELDGTPREMARLVDTTGLARDVEILREQAA